MKLLMRLIFLVPFLLVVMLVNAQSDDKGLVIDDFENGVPLVEDSFGNFLGLVPWGSDFENVRLMAAQVVPTGQLSLPERADAPDTVLVVAYDINGWGGFTHAFTDGKSWTSMDWTDYNALRFWLYGNNTGGAVQIDLFDNRNPDKTGDSSERYFYRVNDDYSGWKQFTIPFELFQRRTDFQPEGAPNDGLGLDEVSGYAFGFPTGMGAQVAYLDEVEVVTVANTADVSIVAGEEATPVAIDSSITWDSRQWELTWSDEFEGAAGTPISSESWTCETGGSGWGNSEHEYYTTDIRNAALDGSGSLVITAREEAPKTGRCWYGDCKYTSARCITQGKVEMEYGRIEARIQIPRGQGIWPAFWMLGNNIGSTGWPKSGELDIMENIGKEPQAVHGTAHGPGYSGGSGMTSTYASTEDFADDYHVYAIDWDEDAIRWYVDGNLYHTLTPTDLGKRTWVYDHPFFIILNVAVGGGWPGYPDDTTVFPQEMKVDYVRVYKLAE